LAKFLEEHKDKSALDRGIGFGEAKGIEEVAEQVATDVTENQTAAPAADDSIGCHFIAFSRVGENLYELDGRYEGPIDHGKTTPATFLNVSVAVCVCVCVSSLS
jgi:ubiquitin carboxyl-terminal hydrolase L3